MEDVALRLACTNTNAHLHTTGGRFIFCVDISIMTIARGIAISHYDIIITASSIVAHRAAIAEKHNK
jgi:hypothetical protein